ncbi:MAG: hypothetical protein P8Q14_03635 [Vicingaceae bacterium]|nr:hypothetical protein [Vicingaceae bacterium]
MRKVTNSFITVAKVLMLALLITGVSVDSFAQKKEKKKKKAKKEKVIERPAASGDRNTDAFVGASFDIYNQNQEISKKLSNLKGSAGDTKQIKADLETQMNEIIGLLGKAGDIMEGAKSITPKSNSMKAVSALNKATKALNATRNAIPAQMEQIRSQKSK